MAERDPGVVSNSENQLRTPFDVISKVAGTALADTVQLARRIQDLERNVAELTDRVETLSDDNEVAKREARTDPLTGVLNRRGFEEVFEEAYGRMRSSQRNRRGDDGGALTLCIIDVDDLKTINDTHGHRPGGDTVLKYVASALQNSVRAHDQVGRWGGDEFAVVLEDETDEAVQKVVKRIWETFQDGLTVTIGTFTTYRDEPIIPEELFDNADKAMYEAKTARKSRPSA